MPGWIITLLLVIQSIWSIRGLVIGSFITHLFLVFFAGVRRREATGVRTSILWAANQWARWAPITAVGMLVGSTPQQEQLVTLWLAFVLLYAAMPDNIAAYSLEDTVLSFRQKAQMRYQLYGQASPLYILIKNFISNGDALLWVSSVVCLMAIGRYWEGAYSALSRGNLKNMRSSRKKNTSPKLRRNSLHIARRGGKEPNDEQILLAAHHMLYITKDAFIDYLDQDNDGKHDADEQAEALSDTWDEKLYKVVNMELSLMYDLIYTKAAMVHTWMGYAIRFASPIAGVTAFVLYCLHSKEGQATADVMITYVLLAGTVILDIKWLIRAVSSTWFYWFLNERPRSWLYHALLCSGKWRLIRRLIISHLNLFRFLDNNKKPTRYRMWSQTIGQFNLLHECTCYESEPRTNSWRSSIFKRCAPEDIWMEYEYECVRGTGILFSAHDIEKLFLDRFWESMKSAFQEGEPPMEKKKHPPLADARAMNKLNIALDFTPDLQQTILILHIATDIFLFHAESDTIEASAKSRGQVKVIKVLSDYMMFLVAVRPSMVPGLVLTSRYEAVREYLEKLWKKKNLCSSSTTREKCLADILRTDINKEKITDEWHVKRLDKLKSTPGGFLSVLRDTSNIVAEGTILGEFLLKWEPGHRDINETILLKKFDRQFQDLMESDKESDGTVPDHKPKGVTEAIFNEWVRQLINVSIRCTRDSHAKQLGRGGELTTVLWILAEHAHILHIKRTAGNKPANYDALRIVVPPY
uniref:DUF4220 domain-containing protein n=1 Tax=Oryza punctata TaxID=4537 RepID=A0A0E0KMH8_ORYPU|nr:hypothetical protein [Oryza punctata]